MINRVLSLLLLFLTAYGAPHFRDTFHLSQPDGTLVPVLVTGDEFYQRVEDLSGRTLVRSQDGWISYASLNSDSSDFIAGEIYTGQSRSGGANSQPHIDLSLEAIKERRAEARSIFFEEAVRGGSTGFDPQPIYGEKVGLTVLVDFEDSPGQLTIDEVDQMLNSKEEGSVRHYFSEVSGGALDYTNLIVGYYRAEHPKSFYDAPKVGGEVRTLLNEVYQWLEDGGFDFSQLSLDGRTVRAVNILYAGGPTKGWGQGLWPHMGEHRWVSRSSRLGTRAYQITGIEQAKSDIGTFCHENGHMLLNYPDLYPYDDRQNGTHWVGPFCIMATAGKGSKPMPPNPYFRHRSGWLDFIDGTDVENGDVRLEVNSPTEALLFKNIDDDSMFIIVEALKREGFYSEYLQRDGLVAWQVREGGNNTRTLENNPLIAVAGGVGISSIMQPFAGQVFSPSTNPRAEWIDGTPAPIDIKNFYFQDDLAFLSIGEGGDIVSIVGGVEKNAPALSILPEGLRVELSCGSSTYNITLYDALGNIQYRANNSLVGTLHTLTGARGVRIISISTEHSQQRYRILL